MLSGLLLVIAIWPLAGSALNPVARSCVVRQDEGRLVLSDIGRDSAVYFRGLSLDPHVAGSLILKYRAVGTGKGGGQLYYAWNGSPCSDGRKWRLPPLVADGKWHLLKLDKSALVNSKSWQGGGLITDLRLDVCDEPGGRVEIAEFGFSEPTEQRVKGKNE